MNRPRSIIEVAPVWLLITFVVFTSLIFKIAYAIDGFIQSKITKKNKLTD